MYGSGDEDIPSSANSLRRPPDIGEAPNLNPGVIIADGDRKYMGDMSQFAKLGENSLSVLPGVSDAKPGVVEAESI
jgi:hypothetical protein